MPRASPSIGRLAMRMTGEFLVIVLGVLVALAVDAWWDRRSDAALAQAYYAALARDLAADTVEYADAIKNIERSIDATEHVLAAIEGRVAEYHASRALVQSLAIAPSVNFPDWSSGTMDELVNAGTIRLLSDTTLKRVLLARYAEAREFRPRAQGPEHSAYLEYRRLIRGMVPLEVFKGTVFRKRPDENAEEDFGVSDDELQEKLRGREELRLVAGDMLVQWWSLWNLFHYERDATRDLLALFEKDAGL